MISRDSYETIRRDGYKLLHVASLTEFVARGDNLMVGDGFYISA